jgi:hypothetical protein
MSNRQVIFLNEQSQGKTEKEIRDLVGFLYKQNIRQFIKDKRKPKSIKDILGIRR